MRNWRGAWIAGIASTALWHADEGRAALEPVWQRAAEFSTVIMTAAKAFGQKPIDAIERVDEYRYRVRAGACSLEVHLSPKARSHPGPQMIEPTAGPVSCAR